MAIVNFSSVVYDGKEGKKINGEVGKWLARDG